MTPSIAWYQSKTVWSSLIALAAGLGGIFGIDITAEAQRELSDVVLQLVAIVASLTAIYGRVAATSRIE